MGTCCSRPHRPEDGRRSSKSHGRLCRGLLTRRQLVRVGVDDSNLRLERQSSEDYKKAAVQSDPMVSDKETISCKSTVNDSAEEQNQELVSGPNKPCRQTLTEPVRAEENIVHIPLCFTVSSLIAMFEDSENESADSLHHKETMIVTADHPIPPLEHPDKGTSHAEYQIPLCETVSSLIAIFEDANDGDDSPKIRKLTDGQSTTNREKGKPETTATESNDTTETYGTDNTECSHRQEEHLQNIMAPKLEPLSEKQNTFSQELHKVHKEMKYLLKKSDAIADNEDEIGEGLTPVCIDDDDSMKVSGKSAEFIKAPHQYTVKDLRDDCIAQSNNRVEIPQNTEDTVSSTDTENVKGIGTGNKRLPYKATKPKEFLYIRAKKISDYRNKSHKTSAKCKHTTDDNKTIYDKYIKSARFDKNGVEHATNLINVVEQDTSSVIIDKLPIRATTHKTSSNKQKLGKGKRSIRQRKTENTCVGQPSCSKTKYDSVNKDLENKECINDIDKTIILDSSNMDKRAVSGENTGINENKTVTKNKPIEEDVVGTIKKNPSTKYGKCPKLKKDVKTFGKQTRRISTSLTIDKKERAKPRCKMIRPEPFKDVMISSKTVSTPLTKMTPAKDTAMLSETRMKKVDDAYNIDDIDKVQDKTLAALGTTEVEDTNNRDTFQDKTLPAIEETEVEDTNNRDTVQDKTLAAIEETEVEDTNNRDTVQEKTLAAIEETEVEDTNNRDTVQDKILAAIEETEVEDTNNRDTVQDQTLAALEETEVEDTNNRDTVQDKILAAIEETEVEDTYNRDTVQDKTLAAIEETEEEDANNRDTVQDKTLAAIGETEVEDTNNRDTVKDKILAALGATEVEDTNNRDTVQDTILAALGATEVEDTNNRDTVQDKTLAAIEETEEEDANNRDTVQDKTLAAIGETEVEDTNKRDTVQDKTLAAIEETEVEDTNNRDTVQDKTLAAIEETEVEDTNNRDTVQDKTLAAIEETEVENANDRDTVQDRTLAALEETQLEDTYNRDTVQDKTSAAIDNTEVEDTTNRNTVKDKTSAAIDNTEIEDTNNRNTVKVKTSAAIDNTEIENANNRDTVKDKTSAAIDKTEVDDANNGDTVKDKTSAAIDKTEIEDANNRVTVKDKTSAAIDKTEGDDANNRDTVKDKTSAAIDKTEIEDANNRVTVKDKTSAAIDKTEVEDANNRVTVKDKTSAAIDKTEVEDANNRDTVKDTTSAANDNTEVDTLKYVTHSKSRSDMVTQGLADAKGSISASEGCLGTASALERMPMNHVESRVYLNVAKSLEKINAHSEKEHCEIQQYVRSPDGLDPRLITLRASPKMIREGFAKRKILESKLILRQNKPPGPLCLEKKRSKMHIGKTSDLVIRRGKDDPKMVQKEGPSSGSMLSSVPQFYEPQGIKQNARQRMGIEKLQKYKITIQCRAIERIKVDENEFPGILPEKLQRKWRAKVNKLKANVIN